MFKIFIYIVFLNLFVSALYAMEYKKLEPFPLNNLTYELYL